MNESTNNENVTPEVEELRKALDQANKSQDTWYNAHARLHAYIEDTEDYLKETYAGTADSDIKDVVIEVLRRLGRPTTKTVDVKVTVVWTGSAEVPLDFDEYTDDLEVDYGWYEPELTYYGAQLDRDLSIDEAGVELN